MELKHYHYTQAVAQIFEKYIYTSVVPESYYRVKRSHIGASAKPDVFNI
jgi:hypothetical protein